MSIARCRNTEIHPPGDYVPGNFANALANIWKSIFRNYSITNSEALSSLFDLKLCKRGSRIKIKNLHHNLETTLQGIPYPKGHYYPLTAIEDPYRKPRFVSCGNTKTTKAPPFSQLAVLFDLSTWVALLVSLVAATIASLPKPSLGIEDLIGDFIPLLKVILEQATRFQSRHFHR